MADSKDDGGGRTGQYRLLYKYLHDRYADRVVLTFSQIGDLVGFPLPPAASTDSDWWGHEAAGDRTAQSEAWVAAERTATVNLIARHVTFDRK